MTDLPMPEDSSPHRPEAGTRAARAYARKERAAARRMADEERWRRPIGGVWDRARIWLNSIFVDHAFIRMAHLNFHPVGRSAFRSAQPTPGQIRRIARRRGVKTVLSLRGGMRFGSLPLEVEACAAEGLAFETAVLRSRALPDPQEIRDLKALVDRVERPVLFHCKAGADRAGLMSVLWLILAEGASVADARGQLALKYGHVRGGPTGILDLFMDHAEAAEARGIPFLDWIGTEYDPAAITAEFKAGEKNRFATWVVDTLLRRE